MDNTVRRIRYLIANDPGLPLDAAREAVRSAYVHGILDKNLGLTPAQCRRIRHKRNTAPERTHFRRQRTARKARQMAKRARMSG